MERSATLGSIFGEHKRTMRKVEGRKAIPSAEFCSDRAPVKASGNHQMQHYPDAAIELEAIRLPILRRERIACPSISSTEGWTVRKRNGLAEDLLSDKE